MKKVFIILFLTMVWLGVNGQLRPPIQQLKENGYDLKEFKSFAKKETKLSKSYHTELIKKVNQFIVDRGLSVYYNDGNPLTMEEKWIDWIFNDLRTWTEDRTYQSGYLNTRIGDNGEVEWFYDKEFFRGPVKVLHLRGWELDLGKEVCTNLVSVPYVYKEKKINTEMNKPNLGGTPLLVEEKIPRKKPTPPGSIVEKKPDEDPYSYDSDSQQLNKFNWKPVIKVVKIAGITVGITAGVAGLGYLAWTLLKPPGGDAGRPNDADPQNGEK